MIGAEPIDQSPPETSPSPSQETLKSQKVAVLIPCLNEEQTIAKVIQDFREALPDAAIYV
jgi:hypothetical protein